MNAQTALRHALPFLAKMPCTGEHEIALQLVTFCSLSLVVPMFLYLTVCPISLGLHQLLSGCPVMSPVVVAWLVVLYIDQQVIFMLLLLDSILDALAFFQFE